ncbi:hypothetical protein FEM48_Zijuj01G0322100 [Ziziphus jujuba var. spinosa]|uniref:EGF-like domain-containing protein n=1 Tax=Ziziphus jujuba var. spinosa TaxID=714518 RepID=A0A978W6G9_ZIZJJ|nr:hypothetical protein FEM48_Zijuj01G0322100 [Ziziphus jujuba var. spinosa]
MFFTKVIHVAEIAIILLLTTKLATSQTKPGCSESCGSVNIPFPFGTTEGCYFDESFLLNCNHSFNPPVLTFPRSNISILNISIPEGELKVAGPVSHDCYNELGNITLNNSDTLTSMFTFSNFSLSTTRNMFTAVGCDTVGVIGGTSGGRNYTTGCVALCNQIEDVRNGSCNGVGCCQMSVQDGVRDFATSIGSLNNHTQVHSFNPCGYTFVADRSYNFSSLDLVNFQNRETVPVVLDWSVGNGTCEAAKENLTGYACQAMHSDCVNSSNGGYRCTCSEGFDGNPYLLDGCQDVNECESSNPCSDNATCENLVGSFNCICAEGHGGDGKRDGTGCSPEQDREDQTLKLAIPLAELEGLSKAMHPWEEDDNLQAEEAESLIKPSNPYLDEDNHGASASNTTTGFDSMKHHIIMPYDDGR